MWIVEEVTKPSKSKINRPATLVLADVGVNEEIMGFSEVDTGSATVGLQAGLSAGTQYQHSYILKNATHEMGNWHGAFS